MTVPGRGQLPNLIIAGVAKGGTTSLFRYLAQHPDICASSTKELRYFEPMRHAEPMAPIESYAKHFRHCAGRRYRMEATPSYFGGGRPVATAMRESLDDARVLVCLREPVQRCWSWYRFVRGRARIPKDMDFGSYLDVCEQLRSVGEDGLRENQPYSGLRGGCYDEWIDAWQELFGERLRIEFFDNLVEDPCGTVEGVLRWLGLDERVAAGFRYDVENRSVQYRSRPVLQAALVLNRRGEHFFERHGRMKRALRSVYYAMNRDSAPEVLDPALRERLAAFYVQHNERLTARLGSVDAGRWPAWLADGRG
jgi:uncharacterized short protein YbdD (DUF466 family)